MDGPRFESLPASRQKADGSDNDNNDNIDNSDYTDNDDNVASKGAGKSESFNEVRRGNLKNV